MAGITGPVVFVANEVPVQAVLPVSENGYIHGVDAATHAINTIDVEHGLV